MQDDFCQENALRLTKLPPIAGKSTPNYQNQSNHSKLQKFHQSKNIHHRLV